MVGQVISGGRMIWLAEATGFNEPSDTPIDEVRWLTYSAVQMLTALHQVERRITERDYVATGDWDTFAIQCTLQWLPRLEAALPQFEKKLPDHKPNMPEFAGCHAASYHAVAVKICRKRVAWLMQLVTWEDRLKALTPAAKNRIDAAVRAAGEKEKENARHLAIGAELHAAETDDERAERYAPIIASRIDAVASHAPQLGGDLRHLIERLRYECEMARAPVERPRGKQKANQQRVAVDIKTWIITIDGHEHQLANESSARWMDVLAKHLGQLISGPSLEKYDTELIGVRTDKLKKTLPAEVAAIIETIDKKGSRMKLP